MENKGTLIREFHEIEKENGTNNRMLFPNYQTYIGLMFALQNAMVEDINIYIEDLPHSEQ